MNYVKNTKKRELILSLVASVSIALVLCFAFSLSTYAADDNAQAQVTANVDDER